jgi:integrase
MSTSETLKDYVNRANIRSPKTGILFTDFIKETVKRKQKRMKQSYVSNYRSVVRHLENFQKENNAILYTESINEDFLDDFIVYMESINAKKTYIKYNLILIKGMVRKAGNYGYAVDPSYDDVDIDDEEIPAIYLSPNDIARIYYYQGLTRRQEKIRDLFVIGCYTALRYSDLSSLKKEDFQNGNIVKITKKTGVRVVIPIHDFVKEIYDKYDGDVSPNVSSQQFNRMIKKICRKIGFTEPVYQTFTRGGKVVTETKEKWELISSHTARRSGATNLVNTGRLKVEEIMRVTGHVSEKSFRRYIKTSKEENARMIGGDLFFRK